MCHVDRYPQKSKHSIKNILLSYRLTSADQRFFFLFFFLLNRNTRRVKPKIDLPTLRDPTGRTSGVLLVLVGVFFRSQKHPDGPSTAAQGRGGRRRDGGGGGAATGLAHAGPLRFLAVPGANRPGI